MNNEDKAYLRRTRATWLSEKTGINYTRASAIINNNVPATPGEMRKIAKAVHEDRVAQHYKSLYKKY